MINSMNFIFSIRTDYFLTNMCLEYLLDMFLPVPSFIVEGFPPPPFINSQEEGYLFCLGTK